MFCGEPALLPPVGSITSGLRSVIQKAKCNLVLLSSLTHYYLGLFISSLRLLLVRLTKILQTSPQLCLGCVWFFTAMQTVKGFSAWSLKTKHNVVLAWAQRCLVLWWQEKSWLPPKAAFVTKRLSLTHYLKKPNLQPLTS